MRILAGPVCGLLITSGARGADAPPVQVMVLGTYHMDNPGQDLHNVPAADVQAGLARVHGIDEQPSAGEPEYFPFDRVQASVHAHGEDAALGALMARAAGEMIAAFGQRQAQASIGELLRDANAPRLLADASMYYSLLALGAGEDQPGADLLGYWYMRNAKIAAKLVDVARPGDRVVVIFGAGHKHWLEQILANMPGVEVVDPMPYL